jgi:hypothetical protein
LVTKVPKVTGLEVEGVRLSAGYRQFLAVRITP